MPLRIWEAKGAKKKAMEIRTPLGKCRTCNHEVAVGAATCPNCGLRRPTKIRTQREQYAAIILCILTGWATLYVVGNWDEIKSDYNRVKRQSDELQALRDETDRLKRVNERWDAVHGTRPKPLNEQANQEDDIPVLTDDKTEPEADVTEDDLSAFTYEEFIEIYPVPLQRVYGYKTWKDKSGDFTVEAKLVQQVTGGSAAAVLEKRDGTTVTVFQSDLSQADRDYLHSMRILRRSHLQEVKEWRELATFEGVTVPW